MTASPADSLPGSSRLPISAEKLGSVSLPAPAGIPGSERLPNPADIPGSEHLPAPAGLPGSESRLAHAGLPGSERLPNTTSISGDVLVPASLASNPRISASALQFWLLMRTLAPQGETPVLDLSEIVRITGKARTSVYIYLGLLSSLGVLDWRKAGRGRLVIWFESMDNPRFHPAQSNFHLENPAENCQSQPDASNHFAEKVNLIRNSGQMVNQSSLLSLKII